MNVSELHFLGWGSEKNKIYKPRRDLGGMQNNNIKNKKIKE